MNRNDIHMANGWLHELPADIPQTKLTAQKAHIPLVNRVTELLLTTLRASHRCMDRSMMRIELRLCEQLA